MTRFTSAREAKEFLVAKIAEEAQREGVPLSEVERKMLCFSETGWTLPDIANGKAPVHLVRTEDGRLFLFNQPGRVLRIKPTPGGSEPYMLEATFTKNVPSVDEPTRIWLDPAGRIVIAYEKRLAILFPSGYIPPRLKDLIVLPEGAEE